MLFSTGDRDCSGRTVSVVFLMMASVMLARTGVSTGAKVEVRLSVRLVRLGWRGGKLSVRFLKEG